MENEKEFDVEQIFDLLDRLICDSTNKYSFFGYKPHLDEYLDIKERYYEALALFKEDLPQINLNLLEFIFKYDYLDIPYRPTTGKKYFDELSEDYYYEEPYCENRNNRLNFNREMLDNNKEK